MRVFFSTCFLLLMMITGAFGGQQQGASQHENQVEGLVRIKSDFDVQETTDRLESLIEKKDALTLMARIDHSQNAAKAGLELSPTILMVFGNPDLGTPLMESERTIGIDLPQKVLIWKDQEGQTWIAYNASHYLKQRHAVEGKDDIFRKIDAALSKLVSEAAGKEFFSR